MKSAGKGGAPALSHIPLPRRKSSVKGLDPNDTDSEVGSDFHGHTTKMSLLAGSSFCCTSAQKEDYEPRIMPRRKVSRHTQDVSAPTTPLVPPSKMMLRTRKKIIESPPEDSLSQSSELGLRKPSHEDSRLRPPDQKGQTTQSSPQRKLSRDPFPFQKEVLETKALFGKKLRKTSNPPLAGRGGKKNREEAESNLHPPKKEPSRARIQTDGNGMPSESSNKCAELQQVCKSMLNASDMKTLPDKKCNVLATNEVKDLPDKVVPLDPMDSSAMDAMQMSHTSDDFDCPCCDRVPETDRMVEADVQQKSEKEAELEAQVLALQEDLEVERQRLKMQTDRVLSLKEELNAIWQPTKVKKMRNLGSTD